MKPNLTVAVFISVIALVIGLNTLFIVHQTEQALVVEFGKPERVEQEPGLRFKLPFLQNVIFFDNRLLDFNAEQKEINASDQKRVIIDAFVRYRITDPLKFYQTVKDESGMRDRLNDILESSLKKVVGSFKQSDLLSPTRATIIENILAEVNRQANGRLSATEAKNSSISAEVVARGGFGIEVVDVRIKRADLPEANSKAIYARMETDREREAKEIRAEGEEQSLKIRATAERTRTEILSEARKKAEIIRGTADGIATKTYATAFSKDKEFYGFYRSMQAYRKALNNKDTTLVLSPNSEFLKYLEDDNKQ